MIRGVVFDMDGLMFDTEKLYDEGWALACKRLGYELPPEVRASFIGLDERSTRQRLTEFSHGTMDCDAILAIVLELLHSCNRRGETPKKPGLLELLEYLKQSGRKIALATSTASSLALETLQSTGLEHWFDVKVFGEMVSRGKPAPDIYTLAASLLELPPQECLALEDSIAGILSASRAGLVPVMIPDRIQPPEELREHLYAVRSDLSQVIPLLEEADLSAPAL